MDATPTTWRMLIESGWTGSADFVAVSGGEAMTRDLADDLCERAGTVWNTYGPTETTVTALAHRVEPGATGVVPLGVPIPGTRVYVLDDHHQPVPDGTIGELYIAGNGVARGYHHRPELTTHHYLDDPFHPHHTMYRTGDLAHRHTTTTGPTYTFHGRTDHQIKLRGQRIELGEIEATITHHPDITNTAVTTHNIDTDDTRLVAYITTTPDTTPPTTHQLRTWCQHHLPDHMIPTIVVPLRTPPTHPLQQDRPQPTPHPRHHPHHPPPPTNHPTPDSKPTSPPSGPTVLVHHQHRTPRQLLPPRRTLPPRHEDRLASPRPAGMRRQRAHGLRARHRRRPRRGGAREDQHGPSPATRRGAPRRRTPPVDVLAGADVVPEPDRSRRARVPHHVRGPAPRPARRRRTAVGGADGRRTPRQSADRVRRPRRCADAADRGRRRPRTRGARRQRRRSRPAVGVRTRADHHGSTTSRSGSIRSRSCGSSSSGSTTTITVR